ncbi:MAG: FlgD immunoglobulin-like domain containing protein [candidate division WOR-3 bacterium]
MKWLKKTNLFLVAIGALTYLSSQTSHWEVWRSEATFPNQGRLILRNSANEFLHLLFLSPRNPPGNLGYTYSSDGGLSWASIEGLWTSYGEYAPSLALDGNTPWASWGVLLEFEPPNEGVRGGVRLAPNNWTTATIWSRLGKIRVWPTSTILSPSGGNKPMAYTVFRWWDQITGEGGIEFLAWELSEGYPAPVMRCPVDDVNSSQPSINVSGHAGCDTIHICYIRRDTLYYRTNTNRINPDIIRGGTCPIWSERKRISTSSTEPASYPSIEFGENRVAIVWRGPNDFGQNIGEIYTRVRNIGYEWGLPINVSKSRDLESGHPESSWGGKAVIYEEQISPSNWEIYFWVDGTKYQYSNTLAPSRYPHCAFGGKEKQWLHGIWIEDNGWVFYRRKEYIPAIGGSQSTQETILNSFRVGPNPLRGATTISYQLLSPKRVQLNIYSVSGKLVRNLIDEFQNPGSYSFLYDGKDSQGKNLPNGVYIFRVSTEDGTTSRAITLTR